MNLIVTDLCNRQCPYCFARKKTGTGARSGPHHMAREDYVAGLEFLKNSRDNRVKLLGGEPTLHPEICRFVDLALGEKFQVTIFTNGLWPREVLSYFQDTATESVRFIFNINEPRDRRPGETGQQHQSLAVAGNRARVGFNIHRPDFDLRFIADLVGKFSLDRTIRLGLACPVVGEDNECVSTGDFPEVGRRLTEQLPLLEARDILASFDCGFPLCLTDTAGLGLFHLCAADGYQCVCSPVLDVGPDLTVRPCFPLGRLAGVRLLDFDNEAELETYFRDLFRPLDRFGCLDQCLECKYLRRGQCSGGCLALTISGWQKGGDPRIIEKLLKINIQGA